MKRLQIILVLGVAFLLALVMGLANHHANFWVRWALGFFLATTLLWALAQWLLTTKKSKD